MSKIPKPDRDALIQRLSHAYSRALLELDGHEVAFRVVPHKGLRYCIAPCINGFFRGAWFLPTAQSEDVPDRTLARRVLRRRTARLYPPGKLKAVNRSRRAAGMKAISKSENETFYWDVWHCPKQLVAHLEREFEGILILEEGHAAA